MLDFSLALVGMILQIVLRVTANKQIVSKVIFWTDSLFPIWVFLFLSPYSTLEKEICYDML